MKRTYFYVSIAVLLLGTRSLFAGHEMANSDVWPETNELIAGRLKIENHGQQQEANVLSVIVELKNRSGHALDLHFDPHDLQIEVFNSEGDAIEEAGVNRSGPVPMSHRMTVSAGVYGGLPTHRGGVGLPVGRTMLAAGWQVWILPPGNYTMKGKATITVAYGSEVLDSGLPHRGFKSKKDDFAPAGETKSISIEFPSSIFQVEALKSEGETASAMPSQNTPNIQKSEVENQLKASDPTSVPKPPRIDDVVVRDSDFEVRCKLFVSFTNHESTPWRIGDFSEGFELISNDYRVHIPKGMLVERGEVAPGASNSITLDLPKVVAEGTWISRADEDKTEPLLTDDGEHLGFRMKLWGQTSNEFQLPRPELLKKEFDAMSQVSARIAFSKPFYFVGEHMPLNYIVKNNADRDIRVSWGGDSRSPRPLRFKIVATKDGQRVPDPYPNPWCMGGMGSAQNVKPGEEYDMGTLALQSYCSFTEPGVYRVRIYHDFGWQDSFENENGAPVPLTENSIPTGKTLAPVAEAELEIKLVNEEQAASVIEQMRESFVDGNLSRDVFSTLQSNAYLPALRAWIDKNGGTLSLDPSNKHELFYGRTAVVGVSGIRTPEATKYLIELLNHKDRVIARDALKQLSLRLPHPTWQARLTAEQQAVKGVSKPPLSDGERLSLRRATQSWREEFRQPILEVAMKLLARPDLPAAQTGTQPIDQDEANRQTRIRAATILQTVARQDDYPRLRDVALPIAREYRDHAAEQGEYPRPQTVTQSLITALWFSFCNGNTEYSPQQQNQKSEFSTNNLGQLFIDGKIDEFTTATLLAEVKTFRPAGWQAWEIDRLSSDLPWVRCHVMERIVDPKGSDIRLSVARNIGHPMLAVQAAAVKVAQDFPSDAYVPALRDAIAHGDQWIKPMAETALKACELSSAATKPESDDRRAPKP